MAFSTAFIIPAIRAAVAAGREILAVYNSGFGVETKEDHSPLTEADKAAHRVIASVLEPTGLPLLSEEGRSISYDERKKWNAFWLVDPLDGTKEFIRRNGEFTVNIALIEGEHPCMGIVYMPVQDILYAAEGTSFYKLTEASMRTINSLDELKSFRLFPEKKMQEKEEMRVVASRSHLSAETEAFIESLKHEYPAIQFVSAGSALKFCLLAEGRADVYPRFAPTMEWDTAAGHALLRAVGKNIFVVPQGREMTYNKPDLVNDWFIAR